MINRQYIVASRAYYAESTLADLRRAEPGVYDDIIYGLYDRSGNGTTGEARIVFGRHREVGHFRPWVRLDVYRDAFSLLRECADFFAALAEHTDDPTVEGMVALLERHGFRDATPTERP